jgi:hypothetical protein
MAEVLLQLNDPLEGSDGRHYVSRVCGRPAPNGGWEGWIEFVPEDGSRVLRSHRETRQADREALLYWATGLTPVYLDGALQRTLDPPHRAEPVTLPEPAYDGPAPDLRPPVHSPEVRAVLDPFSVYAKGEELLRQELSALNAWHLRNIIRGYALLDIGDVELQRLTHAELAEWIVSAVRTATEAAAHR